MNQSVVERREYTRLAVDIEAELVQADGLRHGGRVRDISFAGAYLDCRSAPAAGPTPVRGCVLALQVPGRAPPIRLQCTVVDRQGERIGLRFTGAQEPDFDALRAFLLDQSSEPEALIREFREMPNPAFAARLPRFASWLSQLLRRG